MSGREFTMLTKDMFLEVMSKQAMEFREDRIQSYQRDESAQQSKRATNDGIIKIFQKGDLYMRRYVMFA